MDEPILIADISILEFTLEGLVYALPLNFVTRVIHSIEIRHLPKSPDIVAGIINVRGKVIPVFNIRKRFGLPIREITLDDHIIISETGKRTVAIIVDSVTGIREIAFNNHTDTNEMLPFAPYLTGVGKAEDGLILIYDLNRFLSLEEEMELDMALVNKGR